MRKPKGYWDIYENCYEEAKKYKTRSEFKKNSGTAYKAVLRYGWMDDYTWMIDGRTKLFLDKIDSVYKYYWEETNAIYIGRTLMERQSKRHDEHKKDTVGKYAKENGLAIPPMEIIEENLTVTEGLDREDYWVNYYKEKGYNVINEAKTGIGCGSLGAINSGKWNKKTVFAEAKKYKTKNEFCKGCRGAYVVALGKGWLKEMDWFEEVCKPKGYWNKENVFKEAKKYKTKGEFQKDSPRAYEVARENGWLSEMVWFKEVRKTKGYWNYENVFAEAKKYSRRSEFKQNCETAYNISLKHGWLDDYTWFKESRKQKPNGYWNKENVFEEAKKYKTKNEFKKNSGTAYKVALKNKWLDDYAWFEEGKKPNGYWDVYENCYAEAKKYKTRKELEKKCRGAYNSARKNGWLKDYTWMVGKILGTLKRTKWNKKTVFEEAKKYKTRSEFHKNASRAYNVARRNRWLDDYTWFVDGKIKMLTDKNDSVYRYYWEETNAIYIGRTLISQQNNRKYNHSTSEEDTVYKYAKENGLAIPPMEIIEENITPIEGLEREDYWVNYYKEKGYNVLNKAKTGVGSGSLGAINSGKWIKENVFAEGQKYKTKSEFQKECASAYNVAWRNGWLKEMVWLEEIIKPSGYWNKETAFEAARKYSRKSEFKQNCGSAYVVARRNGWLSEMDWLEEVRKPNGYWQNKENVFAEAKKYKTRYEFQKGCIGAYVVARKNKWLSEMNWFEEVLKPNGYWQNKENVFAEAKKYKTRYEFQKGCRCAYTVARKNKWLDEIFPKHHSY